MRTSQKVALAQGCFLGGVLRSAPLRGAGYVVGLSNRQPNIGNYVWSMRNKMSMWMFNHQDTPYVSTFSATWLPIMAFGGAEWELAGIVGSSTFTMYWYLSRYSQYQKNTPKVRWLVWYIGCQCDMPIVGVLVNYRYPIRVWVIIIIHGELLWLLYLFSSVKDTL